MVARIHLDPTRPAITHRVEIIDPEQGIFDFYIIVGLYEDGRPGELFLKMGKAGSTLRGLLDTIGVETSLLLQYGIPLNILSKKLAGVCFGPSGRTNDPDIPKCTSVVDYIFRWMEQKFGSKDSKEKDAKNELSNS
jgi:ribonucleoside-diphosphate reductase alpha chain